MKSKGFNWFYLIFAAVLLMLFLPGLMSSSDTRKLDEKSFYALLSQNKIKNVVVLKDTDVAQVLTPEAKMILHWLRRKQRRRQ